MGTLTFIWKIDQSLPDHEKCNAHALFEVTETLPKYATRDMKKTFIQRYSDAANCPTMVLRSIFRELTEDSSAASSSKQADIDLRVAQFLLSADDTDLILDLLCGNRSACAVIDRACAVTNRVCAVTDRAFVVTDWVCAVTDQPVR